jgi:hypothetical protein
MRSGVYGIVIERSWEIAAGIAGGADHCTGYRFDDRRGT